MSVDYDYSRGLRVGADENEEDLDFGELQIADYVVFLLALDTYMRWTQEVGRHPAADPVFNRGMTLLRAVERMHLDRIGEFIKAGVKSPGSIAMLGSALRLPPTPKGASVRALKIRTVLSRGGATTAKHVFGSSTRARREVLDAIEASMLEDTTVALNKFAVVVLRDKRLEKWIDRAADTAGKGVEPLNPVIEATKGVEEHAETLLQQKVKHEAAPPTSVAKPEQSAKQAETLQKVQTTATEAASKAIQAAGQADTPPTKSEVIGIATAVATSVASNPVDSRNIPMSLRGLDDEQLDAAMSDGRVLVAAGAGSGKTSTATSRIAYLIQDRHVSPNRILAIAFNVKAASEIRERVAQKIGDDLAKQANIGTMHSMFKKFVCEYGTPEQKASLTTWLMTGGQKNGSDNAQRIHRAPSPAAFAGYMARCWKECKGREPPRRTSNVIQKWIMNDVSPVEARRKAGNDQARIDRAEWFEWYRGFKGATPGWRPPCSGPGSFKADKIYQEFLSKWRDGGRARLGDFTDMITMFRDLLRDKPDVRRKIQGMFDHIIADEGQDLNEVQHQILSMLSEHVGDGSDGKSVWIVGDEVQSVNAFVGARPELFGQFHGKEGWKTKSITTNYRCLPEIVETANKLMDTHPRLVPIKSRPDPLKPRGQASIVLTRPLDHATGAMSTIEKIKQDTEAGAPLSDYAVLTRTNAEINDFETACIVNGIPYMRKGGTSFLKSPETTAVMAYMDLACGQDFGSMQASLAEILNKPNRFFLRAGESERIIKEMVDARARRLGISSKAVNPLDLFDRDGENDFIDALDPRHQKQRWQIDAAVEQFVDLGRSIHGIRSSVEKGTTRARTGEEVPYTTQVLIGDILNVPGLAERGKPPPKLIDQLMPQTSRNEEEGDDPEQEDEASKKPLGNVAFLYKIAQPDPAHPYADPSDPRKFKAKLDDLKAKAKDLRVDPSEWEASQAVLSPGDRKRAPAVTLSTIHSVKGAQWNNVFVVMAKGVFPFEPKPDPKEAQLPPDVQAEIAQEREKEFLTERQVAYVALTRAGKDLTVIAPEINAYGRRAQGHLSQFISEAGLHVGQNVPGKNDPNPESLDTHINVTSSIDEWPSWDVDESYDRRLS